MIEGVIITPLRQIVDERGKVMHMLRADSDVFKEFGEIYFSCVNPGAVKAWHLHKKMTLNYAVPFGKIRLALYDDREGSSTRGELQELLLSPEHYFLVTIPSGIWNGVKGLCEEMTIIANCATMPHDPSEIERLDFVSSHIPYDWSVVSV